MTLSKSRSSGCRAAGFFVRIAPSRFASRLVPQSRAPASERGEPRITLNNPPCRMLSAKDRQYAAIRKAAICTFAGTAGADRAVKSRYLRAPTFRIPSSMQPRRRKKWGLSSATNRRACHAAIIGKRFISPAAEKKFPLDLCIRRRARLAVPKSFAFSSIYPSFLRESR